MKATQKSGANGSPHRLLGVWARGWWRRVERKHLMVVRPDSTATPQLSHHNSLPQPHHSFHTTALTPQLSPLLSPQLYHSSRTTALYHNSHTIALYYTSLTPQPSPQLSTTTLYHNSLPQPHHSPHHNSLPQLSTTATPQLSHHNSLPQPHHSFHTTALTPQLSID